MSGFDFDQSLFVDTFVMLVLIMDPIGNVPVFLALTSGAARRERQRAGATATAVAAGVIIAFALFGRWILAVLGISLESLQVAGGLLLLVVALELLRGSDPSADPGASRNVALVPLGTPLLAGPGAIAATMIAVDRAQGLGGVAALSTALLGAFAVVFLALRFAGLLARLVTEQGILLLSRVFGLLLAAVAVQLVALGVASWIENGVTPASAILQPSVAPPPASGSPPRGWSTQTSAPGMEPQPGVFGAPLPRRPTLGPIGAPSPVLAGDG